MPRRSLFCWPLLRECKTRSAPRFWRESPFLLPRLWLVVSGLRVLSASEMAATMCTWSTLSEAWSKDACNTPWTKVAPRFPQLRIPPTPISLAVWGWNKSFESSLKIIHFQQKEVFWLFNRSWACVDGGLFVFNMFEWVQLGRKRKKPTSFLFFFFIAWMEGPSLEAAQLGPCLLFLPGAPNTSPRWTRLCPVCPSCQSRSATRFRAAHRRPARCPETRCALQPTPSNPKTNWKREQKQTFCSRQHSIR